MKRIVTCSDGTWNKPNTIEKGKSTRTNVQKIFDYILHVHNGVTQIKYYDEGIGAQGNMFTQYFNGATGSPATIYFEKIPGMSSGNYRAILYCDEFVMGEGRLKLK